MIKHFEPEGTTVETDLLARVCAELEQRMAELRPLLEEYERLLEAADTLASIEAAPADGRCRARA